MPTVVSARPGSTTATQSVNAIPSFANELATDLNLWSIVDPDMHKENLVEAKHRRLIRSHRTGALDRELKPNATIRDRLNVSLSRCLSLPISRSRTSTFVSQSILKYPPTQVLEEEEKDLIWKFRFYLSRDKMALTKFLKSVSWTDPSEVKQAVETLLPMWTDVEMVDALELLGPGFVDGRVRAYAVKQLERADDDVSLFLPSRERFALSGSRC
jgi:phosphatidylinositol 3-kinase